MSPTSWVPRCCQREPDWSLQRRTRLTHLASPPPCPAPPLLLCAAVRLLGSLAASYPLLSEGLVGPWQWGGCALLIFAVTRYLIESKKAAERAALAAMQAEAAAQDAAQP